MSLFYTFIEDNITDQDFKNPHKSIHCETTIYEMKLFYDKNSNLFSKRINDLTKYYKDFVFKGSSLEVFYLTELLNSIGYEYRTIKTLLDGISYFEAKFEMYKSY